MQDEAIHIENPWAAGIPFHILRKPIGPRIGMLMSLRN